MTQHIILHVGFPKTGTTAIQRTLADFPETFAPHGIVYPKAGQARLAKRMRGHHNLAYELYDPAKFNPSGGSWEDLAAEVAASDAPNIVLSSEAFRGHLAMVTAAKLRKLFPNHRRSIVMYIRPQWEYVESGYNQLARFGATDESMADFYQSTGRKIADYREIVETWQQAAHDCEVVCLPFASAAKKMGIVEHFCHNLLGVDIKMEEMQQANHKIGLKGLSAIYYCRDEYRKVAKDPKANLPSSAIMQLSRMSRQNDDVYNYTFLTPELVKTIYDDSVETNRWLAKAFPQFDTAEFLKPPSTSKATPVETWPALTPEETEPLRAVIRAALAETREQRLRKAKADAAAAEALEDEDGGSVAMD
ncbi:hypothetical protein [Tateyamaria sp. SN3-11]|uniref:hypothetical protein n=1 Tax=Tateyamaria sp. SN3-11 TaxID=3092147 RepID=UPI0039ECB150